MVMTTGARCGDRVADVQRRYQQPPPGEQLRGEPPLPLGEASRVQRSDPLTCLGNEVAAGTDPTSHRPRAAPASQPVITQRLTSVESAPSPQPGPEQSPAKGARPESSTVRQARTAATACVATRSLGAAQMDDNGGKPGEHGEAGAETAVNPEHRGHRHGADRQQGGNRTRCPEQQRHRHHGGQPDSRAPEVPWLVATEDPAATTWRRFQRWMVGVDAVGVVRLEHGSPSRADKSPSRHTLAACIPSRARIRPRAEPQRQPDLGQPGDEHGARHGDEQTRSDDRKPPR